MQHTRAQRILGLLWKLYMSPGSPPEVLGAPTLAQAISHYGQDCARAYQRNCLQALGQPQTAGTALATLHNLLLASVQEARPGCLALRGWPAPVVLCAPAAFAACSAITWELAPLLAVLHASPQQHRQGCMPHAGGRRGRNRVRSAGQGVRPVGGGAGQLGGVRLPCLLAGLVPALPVSPCSIRNCNWRLL